MRKGLGRIILINIALQVSIAPIMTLIPILLRKLKLSYLITSDNNGLYIFVAVAIALSITGFVWLGFQLKRQYGDAVKYWKYVLIGIIVSIFTSVVFYSGTSIYFELKGSSFDLNDFVRRFVKDMSVILVVSSCMIAECLVVALFHKKMKPRKRTSNDLLDSDIVGE